MPRPAAQVFALPVIPVCPLALAAFMAASAMAPASAQDGSGIRASSFSPSFSASTSYSETIGRSGTPTADGQFVTQLSPGLSWSSRSGRIQGAVSYALNAVFYSKDSDANNVQNALTASVSAEAVPGWAYVDASANISQQSVSPFGVQAVGNSPQATGNRTEVATASISPYVRGSLAGLANYEVRLSAAGTHADTVQGSDSSTAAALFSLSSANAGALFGWGLSASKQRVDFRVAGESESDRVNASVTFRPTSDLQLGVSGGQESTDIIGTESRSYDNWGWTLRWTPTPRTNLALQSERRFFGNSHSFVFSHRLRQAVVQYTDTRGAIGGSDPSGVGQPVTLFDLYFALFASAQPDPALREQLVLDFLRANGRQPGELVAGGLLTTSPTKQRRQDLSFAINGVRTSISLLAFRSESSSIDTSRSTLADAPVRQSGLTATASYRLTPQSTLSLTGAYQATEDNGRQSGNELSSAALSWSTQLGRFASTSLSGRYSAFSGTDSYREAAVTASLALRF